ncbi:MAG: methyltransferase domain-containing protein [Pseudomonadota bacterium]
MAKMLHKAYAHKQGDEAVALYDKWADDYDAEVLGHGYASPLRCAEALAELADDLSAPLLDIGCGTGISGMALKGAGFSVIDGVDPSPEMLEQAKPKGVYRSLLTIDPLAPLEMPDGAYANAAAIGVLSPGLAPPESFDQIMAFLPKGGRLVFSLNDHAVEDGAHLGRLREITDAGLCAIDFKDYGDHMPGNEGMKSWVYVLRKL